LRVAAREDGSGKKVKMGLTRPTDPAAPEIKTVSPSFNLPTSNIPYQGQLQTWLTHGLSLWVNERPTKYAVNPIPVRLDSARSCDEEERRT
jgi:hypothetical protein